MNELLAEIYGTGQADVENDLEKTAAAELLVKLAEAEGVDLNQFSDADIGQMVQELYKTAGDEEVKEEAKAEGESEEQEKKENAEKGADADGDEDDEEGGKKTDSAREKVAEADFLGRVMAHSMVNELDSIQKEAGRVGNAVSAVGNFAKGRGKSFVDAAKDAGKAVTARGSSWSMGERAKALGRAAKRSPEFAAAVAAPGAIATEEVIRRKLKKEKKGSALDELATQRAMAMAKEAGWVDAEGNLLAPAPQVKEASALETAVEQRALEMLEANGYPVQWNE